MKIDWHSKRLDGNPTKAGRYLVTIEGVFDWDQPGPGERCVVTARYSGANDWALRDGVFRIVAWAELPDEYEGE